jgi:hypothetical protein
VPVKPWEGPGKGASTRQGRGYDATVTRRLRAAYGAIRGGASVGEGGRRGSIWKDRPEKILIGKGWGGFGAPSPVREGPAPKAWEGEGLSTTPRKTLTDID